MKRWGRVVFVTVVLLLLAGVGLAAGEHTVGWWTVDGGGGNSSGGDYSLSGTIGQPDAGSMAGGEYNLVGGFWNETVSTLPERRLYLPLVNR